MTWLALVVGIVSNTLASILVKIAGDSRELNVQSLKLFTYPINFLSLVAIFFYGVAFVAYAVSLRQLPLHVAQPIMTSGAILLVALYSFTISREVVSLTSILGVILVVSGVIALTFSGAKQ